MCNWAESEYLISLKSHTRDDISLLKILWSITKWGATRHQQRRWNEFSYLVRAADWGRDSLLDTPASMLSSGLCFPPQPTHSKLRLCELFPAFTPSNGHTNCASHLWLLVLSCNLVSTRITGPDCLPGPRVDFSMHVGLWAR